MKNRNIWKWSLTGLLAVLPLAGGCLQQTSSPPITTAVVQHEAIAGSPPPAPSGAAPEAEAAAPAAIAEVNTNAPAVDPAEAPVKVVSNEKPIPPTIRATGPVSEIIKLANSGVDEAVMLSFATNSTSTFNLGADEIIYLNDIGVPSAVVTAMIQHDQALKETGQAQAAAAAPQHVAPPQPAPQPAPQAPPPEAVATEPAPGAYAAPAAEVTYSTFYDTLSPYGTWIDVEGYGRCWRPTVVAVNSSWSPYLDSGRWVYTDCGWYWLSDYSWGWAPFHYGRWFRHNHMGWCWAPDTVWGPSWVTWRYTDDYCGWAPLPPGAWYRPGIGFTWYGSSVAVGFGFGLGWDRYSFIGWHDFNHHHLHRYAVPHDRVPHFFNRSVAVTRISGNHNRVRNEGIAPERVATATRTPVQRVAIKEVPSAAGRPTGRAERLEGNGRTLAVYRPPIQATTTSSNSRLRSNLQGQGATAAGTAPATRTTAGSTSVTPGPSRPTRTQPSATTPNTTARTGSATVAEKPATGSPAISTPSGNHGQKPATVTSRPTGNRSAAAVPNSTTVPAQRGQGSLADQNVTPGTPSSPSRTASRPLYAPKPAATGTWSPSSTPGPSTRTTPSYQAPSRSTPAPAYQAPTRSAPAPSYRAPAAPSYQAPAQSPRATPSYQAPAPQAQRVTPSYQAPSYQAPRAATPSYQAAPSYQAPRTIQTPSYSAPSYSAPSRSVESPRFSAPSPSYSAPSAPAARAPSFESRSAPAPAPSAARGDSGGGGGRGGGGRGRNSD